MNPLTGPFYVEGAEPGDTLAVHFVSIEPSRDWAASSTIPLFGALTSTHVTATSAGAAARAGLDVRRRPVGAHGDVPRSTSATTEVVLPLDPMHGTVGVAPANFEARSSLVPDAHGGNMDTPEMRAGVTCFLGVNVEGALFALGDGHCRQGEGETCGVAVEAAMDTVRHRRRDQGRADPVAATGVRRPPDEHRLGPAARGRLPDRPARPGHVDRRGVRPRPARRLPAGHPGLRVARSPTSATPTTPSWPRSGSSTCPATTPTPAPTRG